MAKVTLVGQARPLVFALNGERVELPEVDPALTLLTYLRTKTSFRGTKRGCGEGGCGACVVFVARYNPRNKKIEELTVNSCLTLLCSLDGYAITTTEGLGSQKSEHHAIHKRMSGFHASQCGFCTPGMTMALYGTLRKSIFQCSKSQGNGSKVELAAVDAERAIAGNLCRCTGYRPLLDTCKSFCDEVDLEDLGLHQFEGNVLPPYDPACDPIFPQFLVEGFGSRENNSKASLLRSGHTNLPQDGECDLPQNGSNFDTKHNVNGSHRKGRVQPRFEFTDSTDAKDRGKVWIDPTCLADVFEAMKTYQGITEVKLVVGNTAAGYYKSIKPNVYINIRKVEELLTLSEKADGIEVGAAVTISNFIEYLESLGTFKTKASKNVAIAEPDISGVSVPHVLATHLKKVATNHVRNWGSVGGNLMMARLYNFDSDLATILLGVDACVKLVSSDRIDLVVEDVKLEDFLGKGALESGQLLQSVWIPLDKRTSENSQVVFKTFRTAPRPLGNALAYVNAAFYARVFGEKNGSRRLGKVRLAFGAFGTKHAIRARNVEDLLDGKSLTWAILLEAIRLLRTDVIPGSGTSKAQFRMSVAESFLFEFLRPLVLEDGLLLHDVEVKDTKNSRYESELLNSGKQTITLKHEYYPVGQPTTKIASELQASGEAIYVDDIPSPENCLQAAFVYSQEPLARIKSVDAKLALQIPGVVAYISAADIPSGGQNIGIDMAPLEVATLFATDVVECIGHILGIMVADTYEHAKEAAEKVQVDYDTETVGPPVLSVKDAMERKSFHAVNFIVAKALTPVGDIVEGFAEADIKIEDVKVATKSQKHFYMETQTALAIPDEDNCMVVYSSTQAPEIVQKSVASALGVPMHNVRVITRRVGGGFGGKVFRTNIIAVAIALAAYKLRRPVRTSLDRNTDMCLIGGRSPITANFSVAVTKEGRITALKVKVLVEAGYAGDMSTFLAGDFMHALRKYNYGAYEVDFQVCKTNTVPKTAMRGPGQTQGTFLAETIIEQVAARLGLEPELVRERNFHDMRSLVKYFGEATIGSAESYTMPSVWARLKATANWEDRQRKVQEFNAKSTWIKRGLAVVPLLFGNPCMAKVATVSIFPDGSIVAEIGGVEIGQGIHTKARQAAAFALSKLFPEGRGVDSSKIRIVQVDTISMPQVGVTSASTTSEGTCAAIQGACEILVQRLTPLYESLKAGAPNGDVAWESIIAKAGYTVDLQAHHRFIPKRYMYLNYGAAASEVEINTLTGETQILATDLVYDCGKSLNPAVDMGQIEGAFVQGIGFFVTEGVEVLNGRELADGTWNYKIPTVDTITKRLHVELHNSPALQERVLSSKAAGEAPLLLAVSVHSAIRSAIKSARRERLLCMRNMKLPDKENLDNFRLDAPASMDAIKELCGFDNVELYVASMASKEDIKLNQAAEV